MKKVLVLLLISVCLFSCDNENPESDPDLLGQWQLTEAYADPGDGSGTYQPVQSNRTLNFFSDGTFSSNENMCPGGQGSSLTSGTFNLSDSTLSISNCAWNNGEDFKLSFELDGSDLYVLYPCIEGCGEKYRKLEVVEE